MNELALFAGAGGGVLAGKLLGWRTVCAVEWEPYAACVLAARQNDGFLPPFPIWDDVQTFDGRPWRGIVDVVSGGFPCQDISSAGKGTGIDGERSGMWKHMARIIDEVKPPYAFVENSPMLRTRGLGVVLQDLAKMGYNAEWGVVSAAEIGANHKRDRMWIVAELADPPYARQLRTKCLEDNSSSQRGGESKADIDPESKIYGKREWWEFEPSVGRVANGVAARVDRLKALGNGQVPLCAATAWRLLSERLQEARAKRGSNPNP